MIIMKFGGTSVGSAERIKATCSIIASFRERKPVVVVSAVGGITDRLLESAKRAADDGVADTSFIEARHSEIIKELGIDSAIVEKELCELREIIHVITKIKYESARITDIVSSFGERMSAKIVAACMNKQGYASRSFNAYDIGFVTDSNFGSAEILPESFGLIRQEVMQIREIPIITGFIAKDKRGHITTLGRGGSDYTAAIIGAAIGADEIQIWTDVNGVMTTDPRIVSEAKTLPVISFEEAAESAYFGAKVLHPKTIVPAIKKNIPVKVLNSFNPLHEGTTIVSECSACKGIVRIISLKRNITIINVASTRMLDAYGFLAKLFEVFSRNKISVDMLATSEVSVSLTVDNSINSESLSSAVEELKRIGEVTMQSGKAIVCLVGTGMKSSIGLGARVFASLARERINVEMMSQGASEINFGMVVDCADAEKSVRCLHKEFFGA